MNPWLGFTSTIRQPCCWTHSCVSVRSTRPMRQSPGIPVRNWWVRHCSTFSGHLRGPSGRRSRHHPLVDRDRPAAPRQACGGCPALRSSRSGSPRLFPVSRPDTREFTARDRRRHRRCRAPDPGPDNGFRGGTGQQRRYSPQSAALDELAGILGRSFPELPYAEILGIVAESYCVVARSLGRPDAGRTAELAALRAEIRVGQQSTAPIRLLGS